jgi:hypothetical protein
MFPSWILWLSSSLLFKLGLVWAILATIITFGLARWFKIQRELDERDSITSKDYDRWLADL